MDIFNCSLKEKYFETIGSILLSIFAFQAELQTFDVFFTKKIKVVTNLFLPSTFIFVSIYSFYYSSGSPNYGVWRAPRVHSSEFSENKD